MSSAFNTASTSVDAFRSQEFDDSLGLNHNYLPTTPFDPHNPSPFNHSQTLSNSASPSYTPGESEYSDYQPSEFIEDPFFGVNFDAGVPRVDSIPQDPILGNVAYPSSDLNRPLPDLPDSTEDKAPTSATSTSYPLSPVHSNIANTPSPRVGANDIKSRTTISQHELTTDLHNSRFPNFNPHTQSAVLQLTPDNSGSSHTSAEGFEPSALSQVENSPSVMASQWGNAPQGGQSRNFMQSSGQYRGTNFNDFGGQLPSIKSEGLDNSQILRNEDGTWRTNESGPLGLNPDTRRDLDDEPIETLDEQTERLRIANKNREIEDWKSQTGGSSDVGDELPSRSFLPSNDPNDQRGPVVDRRTSEEKNNNIPPVEDGVSVHENQLIEGQTYFNFSDPNVSDADRNLLMSQARLWDDAPTFPYITTTTFQPGTANDAIMRFNRHSDTMSIASRAATWGTRRRSAPSLADIEGIADGSFIKKLAITKPKEETRPRQNSLLDTLTGALSRRGSNRQLKRSRSSQNIPEETEEPPHPRQNSQGSLTVPKRTLSFGRKPTPSINNALEAMVGTMAGPLAGTAHTRNNSISGGVTSPKSPHLGFPRSFMPRHRSKSDLSQDRTAQTGLVGLLRTHGGPPVAVLAGGSNSAAQPEVKKPAVQQPDLEDEDEEDDDAVDDGDMKVDSDQQAEAIVPNYEGFKAHVRRLNPDMESRFNWLVSRIAHQQEIRYKNLLELRVKHSQAINARTCSAGRHCLALGGSVTLTDAKGNPREPASGNLQLVTEFSDNDSNPGEGALTDETFPQGVPMPPTRNLPAEFECQLCFKAKKFQKPSDWTKHVHEDVQPFTCTYDKCKEPKSFKRKADWVRHENERHRHLEWWVCQVDDCRHPCYRKDNFLQHLVREHKLPEPKQKTKAAIKKARLTEPAWIMLEKCHHETTNRPQDEPCKFCGKQFPTWKKLTVHLAKHMEHLSLPILKLVDARSVDANTIISPVEQILTPITPGSGIPKNEFSPSPPFLHGISPHMANQYGPRAFDQPAYYPTTGPPYGVQAQMQQDAHYNPNMYSTYAVQPMTQSRGGFNSMESHGLGPGDQSGVFTGMNTGYTQPKMEPQGFEPMNQGFTNPIPNQQFNVHQVTGFSVPQTFSTAPAVSSFQAPNMLGIDTGYYDTVPVNPGQNFQQVPMSRAPGSASSYGHSPQHVPYYQPQ